MHSEKVHSKKTNSTQDSMRVMLDHGFGFLSINSKLGDKGCTPLHLLCDYSRCSVEAISFLLDRGADIHARDEDERTPLHTLMRNPYTSIEDWRRIRASLLCFLTRGADPRAVDNEGRSVSFNAYNEKLTVYLGDVWDSALAEAGYDIAEFRRVRPRKAKYDWQYSRKDFEDMWRGHEHLCPYYYNDEYYEVGRVKEVSQPEDISASDEEEEEADCESGEWSDSDDGGVGIL